MEQEEVKRKTNKNCNIYLFVNLFDDIIHFIKQKVEYSPFIKTNKY